MIQTEALEILFSVCYEKDIFSCSIIETIDVIDYFLVAIVVESLFDWKCLIIKDIYIFALTVNDLSILYILEAATITLLASIWIIFKLDSFQRHVFEDHLFQDGTNILFNKNGVFLSDLKIKPFRFSSEGFVVIY